MICLQATEMVKHSMYRNVSEPLLTSRFSSIYVTSSSVTERERERVEEERERCRTAQGEISSADNIVLLRSTLWSAVVNMPPLPLSTGPLIWDGIQKTGPEVESVVEAVTEKANRLWHTIAAWLPVVFARCVQYVKAVKYFPYEFLFGLSRSVMQREKRMLTHTVFFSCCLWGSRRDQISSG